MITLNGIGKVYRTDMIETVALENVNLHIGEGEFVSIMGPSGCGKSTLLNLMGLLDTPTQGTLEIAGRNALGLSDREAARLRNQTLGFVFQSFHLIPSLSVEDNVMVPLVYRGIPYAKRRQMAREALEQVGLSHRLHHLPNQLSGGQQQRVSIGRALVNNPALVLADEPTGNLDSENSREIMALLRRFNREFKQTVIVITHDENIALSADRVLAIEDGKIVRDEVQSV